MKDSHFQNIRVQATEKGRVELVRSEEAYPDAPHAVFGRTLCSLVSPGTEIATIRRQWDVSFPANLGYAAVMEVESIGCEVTRVKPGDRVFLMGNHARCNWTDENRVVPVPDALESERAVFARMMGVTLSILVTTTARPPGPVLVTGLGLVGNLAAQNFQAAGYEVMACDPDPERREIARRSGIDRIASSVPLEDETLKDRVALAVECAGHEQAVLDACKIVRPRGEVVLAGVPWERKTDRTAHEILYEVFHRYVVLRSGWEWELPQLPAPFRIGSIFGNFESAMRWLAEGRVRVDGLARRENPRDAAAVYDRIERRKISELSVWFDWNDMETP